VSALVYLLSRSTVNSVLLRLKRLRQPKYLLGAVLAVAYIYFYFYQFLFLGGQKAQLPLTPAQEQMWRNVGAALLLVAALTLGWILPASRAAVTFTEAEISFLFPAPIRRRTLIIFKILRSQLALLFIAVLFTFITGRWRSGVDAWTRMGSWWIILNTLSLHRIGASFALSRLHERGLADWKRRVAFIAVAAGIIMVAWHAGNSLPPSPLPALGRRNSAIYGYVNQVFETGLIPYLLAPFKLVVAPYFSHGLMPFLLTLPASIAILAAHFIWVVRADASFEDAAIEHAKRRSAIIAAARKGDVRLSQASGKAKTPVFRLRPTGLKATAFLWKSLIRVGGLRTLSLWTLFFGGLMVAAYWITQQQLAEPSAATATVAFAIGGACYIAVIISFVMVGQQAAGQLRQGIAGMDLLKTYPLPGWQFALGELLGPLTLGTLIQWVALGIGSTLALALATPNGAELKSYGIPIIASVALFLPLFNLGSSILPGAAALAFPGWFKTSEVGGQQGGLEVMGLRLLVGISQILLIAIAFIPVAFFGAAGWVAASLFTPELAWKVASAAGSGIVILTLEAACGVAWLGWLFDRFDLSSE
jgi:ABC-2 type transport system permease protein